MPGVACPVCERTQALPQLLATRAAFDLEVALFGLPAVMGKPQKGELLRFLAALVRRFPRKTAELDASGFRRCQLQLEFAEPFWELLETSLRIVSVLKARQKVVGEAKVVRLPATLLPDFVSEP